MEQPLISVIIPVFNNGRFIKEGLDSVFKQNYPNLEIIVINDGSTDNTAEVLSSYGNKITVINQKNFGAPAARNRGIEASRGEIIAMLDADDIWPDDHISFLLPHVTGNDSHDAVRGHTRYIRNVGTDEEELTEAIDMTMLVGAYLFKRSFFDSIGIFDEEMKMSGEDFDLIMRAVEKDLRILCIPEVTLFYRRHEGNMTNRLEVRKNGQIVAMRKRIERTRNKPR